MKNQTKNLVLCALFAALVTLSTIVIQIPSPMSGYVNLGDVFVLTAAFLLGPIYGTVAAGVGSMLADVFTGYVIYAPGTLIIKAAMAIVAYVIYAALMKSKVKQIIAIIVAAIVAELLMVAGYFGYSALIIGESWAALASVPGNLIQGAVGASLSTVISLMLKRSKFFD